MKNNYLLTPVFQNIYDRALEIFFPEIGISIYQQTGKGILFLLSHKGVPDQNIFLQVTLDKISNDINIYISLSDKINGCLSNDMFIPKHYIFYSTCVNLCGTIEELSSTLKEMKQVIILFLHMLNTGGINEQSYNRFRSRSDFIEFLGRREGITK